VKAINKVKPFANYVSTSQYLTKDAHDYLADNGPVVTNRNTVTQPAMMQPTAA
jgi:hypothetical protein